MDRLLSSQLVTHGTDVAGSKLSNLDAILLYFGACWSIPCKELTPYLTLVYNQINRNGKVLEVVYVSLDPTEGQFRESFREMPWLGVNRRNADIIEGLRNNYQVDSVPSLILVKPNGEVLKRNCADDVIHNGAKWLRPFLVNRY